MADVLRRGLTRAGLAVDVAERGVDALLRAGATDFDAIVLDAMLPRDPARRSDATPAMVERQLAEWEPLDEVPAAAHSTVRADQDPAEVVDEVEGLLDRRLTHAGR